MRLLLDQNLSRHLRGLLEGSKFDAIDTRSLGLQRANDAEIVDVALRERRIIVSADSDFGAILSARQAQKPSSCSCAAHRVCHQKPSLLC